MNAQGMITLSRNKENLRLDLSDPQFYLQHHKNNAEERAV